MEIIPAIDIIEGKCTRLTNGDFNQKKVYDISPLEVAKQFEDAGLTRLHLVDLDGARTGVVKNWKVLETIAGKTSLLIDFGGGIRKEKDVQIVLDSGASLVTVGSIAVKDEQVLKQWISLFHPGRFFIGADVKKEKIAVNGWQETTDTDIYDFIRKWSEAGLTHFFCTDVSKDGKLEGPATGLYKNILSRFPMLGLTASGGVASLEDLQELKRTGCKGVIIGKALYENKISLNDLKKYILGQC